MLAKLEFYGITGVTYSLIRSYLQGRYQKVVLNNHFSHSSSNWEEVTHDVPQGSILGPLLFLLYINDLPQITNENSKIVLFTDDTSVIVTNPDPHKLGEDVNKMTQDINDWFDANLLSLNIDKTHFMRFVTKNSSFNDFDSSHGNVKLAMVDNTKFLGLTLDNSLTWQNHIDTIAPKLSSACFALRLLKPLLSWDALKIVYFSYFHSIMT